MKKEGFKEGEDKRNYYSYTEIKGLKEGVHLQDNYHWLLKMYTVVEEGAEKRNSQKATSKHI